MSGRFEHCVAALNGDLRMRAAIPARCHIEFVRAPGKQRSRPYFATVLPWLRAQRPDLLLTYGWGTSDVLFAALLLGMPRVVHAEHGFGPDELPNQLRRRLWARRLLYRRVSRLVVPSRTLERVARDLWLLPQQRISFIPSGVDTTHFRTGSGAAVRAELGIPADAVVLGSVGRLDEGKDVDRLITAAAALPSLPKIHIILVGDGNERGRLAALAIQRGLCERVHFVGFSADPYPYYLGFDVFVLTSRSEQRPLALLEAMACGLPVVATDVGDVLAMVGAANRPFVVAYGGDRALTDALKQLVQNASLRKDLGRDNRQRCEDEFDTGQVVARYAQLYDDVMRDAPVPEHGTESEG